MEAVRESFGKMSVGVLNASNGKAPAGSIAIDQLVVTGGTACRRLVLVVCRWCICGCVVYEYKLCSLCLSPWEHNVGAEMLARYALVVCFLSC